jgi:uroporphyrinogen-III decarboxylase
LLPRERIYLSISGKVPDRVPNVPKIWVDLGARLTQTDLLEVIQNPLTALKVIAEAALLVGADGARQFHFPKRKIIRKDEKVIEVNQKGKLLGEIDMLGGLLTQLYDEKYFDLTDPYQIAHQHFWSSPEPLIKNKEDVKRIVVPDRHFYKEIGCGERQQEIFKRIGEKCSLIGDCDSATLAFYVDFCGYQKALMDLIDNPSLVHATMEKGVAIAVEKGKFNIDLGFRVLRLNDSVANMSVISPQLWREFIFPHMKEVCTELHHYCPEVKIYCHICGNILPVVSDLVETGLDCIGPLDPLGHFTPAQVRELVGKQVSLLGGVNTLSFLQNSPEEILEEARRCIQGAGKKGGYILSSGCVIPRGASKEKLKALKIAVEKYGVYQNGILKEN